MRYVLSVLMFVWLALLMACEAAPSATPTAMALTPTLTLLPSATSTSLGAYPYPMPLLSTPVPSVLTQIAAAAATAVANAPPTPSPWSTPTVTATPTRSASAALLLLEYERGCERLRLFADGYLIFGPDCSGRQVQEWLRAEGAFLLQSIKALKPHSWLWNPSPQEQRRLRVFGNGNNRMDGQSWQGFIAQLDNLLNWRGATPTPYPHTSITPIPIPTFTPKSPEVYQREYEQARTGLIAQFEQHLTRAGVDRLNSVPPRFDQNGYWATLDFLLEPKEVGEKLLALVSIHPEWSSPGGKGLFILSWTGQVWLHQELDAGQYSADPWFVAAYQEAHNGFSELGIAWSCQGCSTGYMQYLWLRFDGRQWVTVWRPTLQEWRGAHGSLKFVGGLHGLEVHYSDWSPPDQKLRPDGKSIFGASNAGPHRYFIDTWLREGDRYRLVETVSIPSTYKTAVEFCYALLKGDVQAAAAWTTNAMLVQRARDLGLDKMLRDEAIAFAADDDRRGTVVIGMYKPGDERLILLRMVKPQQEWLIAAIEKTDSLTPTPP